MNTIEDRLREALRQRAAQSPVDPDAWAHTVTRSRRRRGRVAGRTPGWSRLMIPLASAAAVVAIIVGATTLTGHGSLGGGSGTTALVSPSASGAPAPPGRNDYLIQSDPPVSAIVQVKMPVEGYQTWVSLWFSEMRGNPGRTVLCSEVAITGSPADGFCESAQIPAGHVAVLTGNNGVIAVGAASAQVASVSAQWPGGHSAGKVIWGRGFPARVWLLSLPVQESSRIVFRGAAGADIGKLTLLSRQSPISHPHNGGITVARYPAGWVGPRPGTITAYLAGGQIQFWALASADFMTGYSTVPANGQPALSVFHSRAMAPASSTLVEFYGYAPQNVARVTLRLSDGRQFGARTRPGWPGSGLRLWSVLVPGSVPSLLRYLALGYDVANQVVSQLTASSPG